MNKRPIKQPEEQDAYTGWRKVLFWQRGELAAVKRRTHKRERQEGKRETRTDW